MGGLEKVGGGEGGAKLPQPRIDVVHVSCTRYGDVHECRRRWARVGVEPVVTVRNS